MSLRILFKVCLPLIAAPLLSIFTTPEAIAASQNQQKLWLEPGISSNSHNSLLISRDDRDDYRDRYRDSRYRRREIRREIRRLERQERRLRNRRDYDRDRYYRQRVYDRHRDRDYDRRYPAYPIRRGY